jgi:hypothetical protein
VARGGAVGIERHCVGERMADETRVDAVLRVDRRLHREQAEHAIGAAADLRRTFFAPCPHRRADVVHGSDASLLEATLDAKVEVRCVDTDERIGCERARAPHDVAADRQQFGQMAQHFDVAHHREFFGGMPGVESGSDHLRTADAGKCRVGKTFAQRADQVGAEQVAGGFAGDEDEMLLAGVGHRANGRSPRSMKSSIAATSALPAASSASLPRASASGRPET